MKQPYSWRPEPLPLSSVHPPQPASGPAPPAPPASVKLYLICFHILILDLKIQLSSHIGDESKPALGFCARPPRGSPSPPCSTRRLRTPPSLQYCRQLILYFTFQQIFTPRLALEPDEEGGNLANSSDQLTGLQQVASNVNFLIKMCLIFSDYNID